MIMATKIRLKLTKEQEVLFWKSAGTARCGIHHPKLVLVVDKSNSI
ncbi:helix-turn-helix domain-containing protein [Lysinibacillus zambalensis]